MSLIISRILITLFLFYLTFLLWTNNVDLLVWGKKMAVNLLPISSTDEKDAKVNIEIFRGAIKAKFFALRKTLKSAEENIQKKNSKLVIGDSPKERLNILRDFGSKTLAIEENFNAFLDKSDIFNAHEELNKLRQMAADQESLIVDHRELFEQSKTMSVSAGGYHGMLVEWHTMLRESLDDILGVIDT